MKNFLGQNVKCEAGLMIKTLGRLLLVLAVSVLMMKQANASFEPLPVGARSAGMGDAYTVVADDSLSVYYNPAGMMHVRRPEVGTYYSRLFTGMDDQSEISRSFIGYVQPLESTKGRLGVSYISLALNSLYREDTFGVSYAKAVHKKWNVGGSLKMLRKSFGSDQYTDNAINVDSGLSLGSKDPLLAQGNSKSAIALDLGTQMRLTKNYALGLAFRNVNQPNLAIGSRADKAPAVYAMGISRWTRVSSLSLELSNWKFANSQDIRLNAGGERWFRSGLGIRAGLGLGSRKFSNMAVGGSYRMDGFQFDYALNYPLQGIEKTAGTHMVSLTFRFGKPAPDPIEAMLEAERQARLRAEAELARLRQQLIEMTAEKPIETTDTSVVDAAVQEAMKQAEEEVSRLQQQKAPEMVSAAPVMPVVSQTPAAVVPPTIVRPTVPPPAKKAAAPRMNSELLTQYGDALNFYSLRVKEGAPVAERRDLLTRILDKYADKGVDTSIVRSELKKIDQQGGQGNQDYKLAVNYYRRIVQQGTSPEERILLMERIIKKFKPLGVDTSELEKELADVKKKS